MYNIETDYWRRRLKDDSFDYFSFSIDGYEELLDEIDRLLKADQTLEASNQTHKKLFRDSLTKLEEIVNDIFLEFSNGGLRIISPFPFDGYDSREIKIKIIIEGRKQTFIDYDFRTHEISGLVWMSLGDRNLTDITDEEVEIIRRSLLVWIYENII